MIRVVAAENLAYLKTLSSGTVDLIYIDPPFNTGHEQIRTHYRMTRSDAGTRRGFNGVTYSDEILSERRYSDNFDDYLNFLRPRIEKTRSEEHTF